MGVRYWIKQYILYSLYRDYPNQESSYGRNHDSLNRITVPKQGIPKQGGVIRIGRSESGENPGSLIQHSTATDQGV
jgi:hypothetical protein